MDKYFIQTSLELYTATIFFQKNLINKIAAQVGLKTAYEEINFAQEIEGIYRSLKGEQIHLHSGKPDIMQPMRGEQNKGSNLITQADYVWHFVTNLIPWYIIHTFSNFLAKLGLAITKLYISLLVHDTVYCV